jgi:hypothetical protein
MNQVDRTREEQPLFACQGGYRGCTGMGPMRVDPYVLELDGVTKRKPLCDVCLAELHADI